MIDVLWNETDTSFWLNWIHTNSDKILNSTIQDKTYCTTTQMTINLIPSAKTNMSVDNAKVVW